MEVNIERSNHRQALSKVTRLPSAIPGQVKLEHHFSHSLLLLVCGFVMITQRRRFETGRIASKLLPLSRLSTVAIRDRVLP